MKQFFISISMLFQHIDFSSGSNSLIVDSICSFRFIYITVHSLFTFSFWLGCWILSSYPQMMAISSILSSLWHGYVVGSWYNINWFDNTAFLESWLAVQESKVVTLYYLCRSSIFICLDMHSIDHVAVADPVPEVSARHQTQVSNSSGTCLLAFELTDWPC